MTIEHFCILISNFENFVVHVGDEKVIQLKCGLKMTAVVRPALLWTLYPSTNIARLAAKCSLCSANLYD